MLIVLAGEIGDADLNIGFDVKDYRKDSLVQTHFE